MLCRMSAKPAMRYRSSLLVAGSTRCCRRRSRRNQTRAQCAVQHNDSAHGKAKGSVEMNTQHQLGEGDQRSAIVTSAQPCVPSIVWDCGTGKCLLLRNVCIVPIWLRNVPIWLRNVAEKCLHRPNMALIPILQLARLVCNHAPGLTCARPAQSFITRRCVARCLRSCRTWDSAVVAVARYGHAAPRMRASIDTCCLRDRPTRITVAATSRQGASGRRLQRPSDGLATIDHVASYSATSVRVAETIFLVSTLRNADCCGIGNGSKIRGKVLLPS